MRFLLNTSRSFIFSTAPPPPSIAGALAALELLQERPHRVERLNANARALRRALAREGFAVADGDMHIVPLVVGDERDTLRLCQETIERGVFAQAIRPPTVAPGTSRLRLAAMASHTATDMRMAAEVLAAAARKLGLDPAQVGTPPERQPADEPDDELEREAQEPVLGRPAPAAPFDVERPRPPRPPAPADVTAGAANTPFDGERENVASAA